MCHLYTFMVIIVPCLLYHFHKSHWEKLNIFQKPYKSILKPIIFFNHCWNQPSSGSISLAFVNVFSDRNFKGNVENRLFTMVCMTNTIFFDRYNRNSNFWTNDSKFTILFLVLKSCSKWLKIIKENQRLRK